MFSTAARGAVEAERVRQSDTQWSMRKLKNHVGARRRLRPVASATWGAVMRRRDRKPPVRPTRIARKELQALKDGISTAVKQLNEAHEDLGEVNSFVFVCIQALRAKGRDDVGPDVATVLDAAYEKLALDLNRNLRDALEALDENAGKRTP